MMTNFITVTWDYMVRGSPVLNAICQRILNEVINQLNLK